MSLYLGFLNRKKNNFKYIIGFGKEWRDAFRATRIMIDGFIISIFFFTHVQYKKLFFKPRISTNNNFLPLKQQIAFLNKYTSSKNKSTVGKTADLPKVDKRIKLAEYDNI